MEGSQELTVTSLCVSQDHLVPEVLLGTFRNCPPLSLDRMVPAHHLLLLLTSVLFSHTGSNKIHIFTHCTTHTKYF